MAKIKPFKRLGYFWVNVKHLLLRQYELSRQSNRLCVLPVCDRLLVAWELKVSLCVIPVMGCTSALLGKTRAPP